MKTHWGEVRKSTGNINYSKFPPGWTNYIIRIGEVRNSNFFQRGVVLQVRFFPGSSVGWIQSRHWGRVCKQYEHGICFWKFWSNWKYIPVLANLNCRTINNKTISCLKNKKAVLILDMYRNIIASIRASTWFFLTMMSNKFMSNLIMA